MSGSGNKRCRPLECLIDSGIYKLLAQSEQRLAVALDYYTNRKTGLCYPSERIITEQVGLSRSRQQEGRKRCLARKIFAIEMRKVNRKGNAVMHYIWPCEAWKSSNLAGDELRPNFDRTPTQFPSNPDPIPNGGSDRKGGVHMGNPDPKWDGVPISKPLTNPLLNPSAPYSPSLRENKEMEVARTLKIGKNLKGQEHTKEYWEQVRALKERGLGGEALTKALEEWGIK